MSLSLQADKPILELYKDCKMGFNDERYFYISGAISFFIFALLILLFGLTLLQTTTIQNVAMVQSDTISVSLDINNKPAVDPQPAVIETLPESVEEEPVQEEAKTSSEPIPEISDLFSSVKAPDESKKKKEDQKKRDESLQNLEKQILERQKNQQQFSDKVKSLELVQPSIKMVAAGGSTGPVVNEYHAKIQALVYTAFHPSTGTQGSVSRVKMVISADGRLITYKVLSYSSNNSFNSETDWLKERLKKIIFPPHPEGKDAVLEFILTAKE